MSKNPYTVGDLGRVVFPDNGAAHEVVVHNTDEPRVLIVRQIRDGRTESFDHRLICGADGQYRTPVVGGVFIPSKKEEPMATTPATPHMSRSLTEEEKEVFNALRDPGYDNFALVKGEFDGAPVAFIAAVNIIEHGEDEPEYCISPIAVLLSPALLDRATMDGKPLKDDGRPPEGAAQTPADAEVNAKVEAFHKRHPRDAPEEVLAELRARRDGLMIRLDAAGGRGVDLAEEIDQVNRDIVALEAETMRAAVRIPKPKKTRKKPPAKRKGKR